MLRGEFKTRPARLLIAVLVAGAAWAPAPGSCHPGLDEIARVTAEGVAHDPDDPAAQLNLAQVRRLAGNLDGALVALEHAAAHGAPPEESAALRGTVFLDAGWPNMALLEFERSLALRPEQPAVHLLRARASMALGRPEDAAQSLGAAIDGMPEPSPDHFLARRDALIAMGDPAAALETLDHGLARLGMVVALQMPAIELALELGRTEDALRRIDALLVTSPRNEAWLARRGDILNRQGRHEEARLAFVEALQLIGSKDPARRGQRSERLEREIRAALAPIPEPPDVTREETP